MSLRFEPYSFWKSQLWKLVLHRIRERLKFQNAVLIFFCHFVDSSALRFGVSLYVAIIRLQRSLFSMCAGLGNMSCTIM